MFTAGLRKYFFIAKYNLQHNFLFHIAIALLLLCLGVAVFGISNLDAESAAAPLERFVVLIGIMMLVPVFMPEEQLEIREVVESKLTSPTVIHVIRMLCAAAILLVLIAGFAYLMILSGSSFPLLSYIGGTLSGAFFLGALGVFAFGIFHHIAVGYMIPLTYYLYNMLSGSASLGKLTLFSMSSGSYEEKYWLLFVAILLIVMTLFIKAMIRKGR